jgi:hypothetical protein
VGILNVVAKAVKSGENHLDKSLSAQNIDTSTKLQNKVFNRYSFSFVATTSLTEISFADLDERKSTFGVLLDDVSLIAE